MYNRQKGELKYSPQLGYYYDDDLKKSEKYQNIFKIALIVVALFAVSGGLYWLLKSKESNKTQSTPIKTTQPKPQTASKELNTTLATPTIQEEKNTTVPQTVPTTQVIVPTPEVNTSVPSTPKDVNTTEVNATDTNHSANLFDRGEQNVFFTSMGKSVEGAVIQKNVQEVNLELDDTKAKEEIKKEQANNGITPPKDETKTKQPKKVDTKPSTQTVTVKSGDTIYKIAKRAYGDSNLYKKILQANKIRNIRSLKIGQKLIIPPK